MISVKDSIFYGVLMQVNSFLDNAQDQHEPQPYKPSLVKINV